MATTNYSLPTLESTALFDLVTDYNALANATDAALANVAGLIPSETITEMQGQISALQTLTGSQHTQITTLQSQMTTANGTISTLQSGLATANNNIGPLQTGLQTATSSIAEINADSKNNLVTQIGEVRGTKFGTARASFGFNPLINLVTVLFDLHQWGASAAGTEQVIGTLDNQYRPSTDINLLLDANISGNFTTYGRVKANGTVSVVNIAGTPAAQGNASVVNGIICYLKVVSS